MPGKSSWDDRAWPGSVFPLGPGLSQSKAKGQVLAVTGTSVTLSPYPC